MKSAGRKARTGDLSDKRDFPIIECTQDGGVTQKESNVRT